MGFLIALFVVVEVVCCLLLIGLILLQRSKSEGLGMAFGASTGESLFGARAGNVLSRATVILGSVFLASSVVLGVLYSHREQGAGSSLMDSYEGAPVSADPTAIFDVQTPAEAVPGEIIDFPMPEANAPAPTNDAM